MRTRCGRSLKPLSSTNTKVRRCWRAFFYLGPAHLLPTLDRPFIALGGSPHRSLATPAQRAEDPPHMPRMKFMPGLALDQIGHPPGRPQTSAISQRLGPLLEPAAKLIQLGRLQPRFAPSAARLPERPGSLRLPGLMPAAD